MTNNITVTATLPASWFDLWELNQTLEFDTFLDSDLLASRRNEIKFRVISYVATGSVSFLASACLTFHILRSHDCLSTTYHRLVFGLSVADMVSSFAMALSSTMVPKELNYYIPYAQGSTATCTTQGFLVATGFTVATSYNCCICFYYLSIIKYNKKDEYIQKKLEPWFHGVSILFPLAMGSVALGMKGYNTIHNAGPICFLNPNNPPHCIGRDSGVTPDHEHFSISIPCGRGDGLVNLIALHILRLFSLAFSAIIIVGTMFLMYRKVAKIEKKLQKYGARALHISVRPGNATRFSIRPGNAMRSSILPRNFMRSSTRQGDGVPRFSVRPGTAEGNSDANAADDDDNDNEAAVMDKIKRACKCMTPPCLHSDDQLASRSNRFTCQKRSILHMALAYSMAWVFVWIPFILVSLHRSYPTEILNGCFTPLQGLYNFLVFMSPKVRNAKRSRIVDVTWIQAFVKAYLSRGAKNIRRQSLGSSGRSSNKSSWRKFFGSRLSFQRSPSRNASNVPSERVNIQGHSEENTNQTTDHLKTAELNREGRILLSDEEEKHEKQDALYRSRGKVTFSLPPTRPPTVEKIEQSKI